MCILLTPWKQWKGRAALRSRWKPRFLISKICQPTEYGSDLLSHWMIWMWHCAAADYLNDDVLTTWRPDNAAIVSILSLETVKRTQGPLGSRARSHGHFTVVRLQYQDPAYTIYYIPRKLVLSTCIPWTQNVLVSSRKATKGTNSAACRIQTMSAAIAKTFQLLYQTFWINPSVCHCLSNTSKGLPYFSWPRSAL